jgi:hypothetical protein
MELVGTEAILRAQKKVREKGEKREKGLAETEIDRRRAPGNALGMRIRGLPGEYAP